MRRSLAVRSDSFLTSSLCKLLTHLLIYEINLVQDAIQRPAADIYDTIRYEMLF